MYTGYLEFGSDEVVNNNRAQAYAAWAGVPLRACDVCDELPDSYVDPVTDGAPWVDPSVPGSGDFLGVAGLSFSGFTDSTRSSSVTESMVDGGFLGRGRSASRQLKVRALLTATTQLGMEAGMSWLSAVLARRLCVEDCGPTDLVFFIGCPIVDPVDPTPVPKQVARWQRRFVKVGMVSAPSTLMSKQLPGCDAFVAEVEFVLQAGNPRILSVPRPLSLVLADSGPYTDNVRNYEEFPSVELGVNAVYSPSIALDTVSTTIQKAVYAEFWNGFLAVGSGGTFASAHGGGQWLLADSTGRLGLAVDASNGDVYAITASTIARSVSSGYAYTDVSTGHSNLTDIFMVPGVGMYAVGTNFVIRSVISPYTSWATTGLTNPTGAWQAGAAGGVDSSRIVLVGTDIRAASADDGATWSVGAMPDGDWCDVEYFPEQDTFIAVANGGVNRIATSEDGINWQVVS